MANLAGMYKLKAWHMRGSTRVPPGQELYLTHEEAASAIANGVVRGEMDDKPAIANAESAAVASLRTQFDAAWEERGRELAAERSRNDALAAELADVKAKLAETTALLDAATVTKPDVGTKPAKK